MRPRVAFQGEPGAFSEEAIQRLFEGAAEPVPYRDFADVGRAVATGGVDFGLLPIENTLAGSVLGTYDVLAAEQLRLVGEIVLPIHHLVLGLAGASLMELDRVISHPVALAQCTGFFRSHPGTQAVAVYDTAGAAKEVASHSDRRTAAIASRAAAKRYGLEVLATNVEDRTDNQTRFVLAQHPENRGSPAVPSSESLRTHLLVETPNTPGSLVRVLLPFAQRDINLLKLEARPTGEPWTYRFFLELELDVNGCTAADVLEEARSHASGVRILGCYARASGAPRAAQV